MMNFLARPTEIIRTTVKQEVSVILKPCADASVRERKVQVLVPETPKVFMALDVEPGWVGPNRTYKLPVIPPGVSITFHLQPGQVLVAAADAGVAEVTVIVESFGGSNA